MVFNGNAKYEELWILRPPPHKLKKVMFMCMCMNMPHCPFLSHSLCH